MPVFGRLDGEGCVPVVATSPAEVRSAPSEAVLGRHTWQGYACESRLVRSRTASVAPVVLVGGAFQTKESWGRVERVFLEHADVLSVDLPGWGAGDVLPPRYGADFLADALCRILDDTGLSTVNLLGGSYGTAIGYVLAQRRPERIERMVLVGTMARVPDHARRAICRTVDLLTAGRMEEFAAATLELMVNADTVGSVTGGSLVQRVLFRRLVSLRPAEVAQHIANTQRLLNHPMLEPDPAPPMPVLVATGEYDHFTTPELCRALAARCRDSWFALVADADHMLPLERRAETADLALRFLTGTPLDGLGYCRGIERVSGPAAVA